MTSPIRLTDFVTLGQTVCIVANPQPWHCNVVVEEIGKLLRQLNDCGMHRTRLAATPLDNVNVPYNTHTGLITGMAIKEIVATMKSVCEVLYAEANERELVAINTGIVSRKLRDVHQKLTLTDAQTQLRDETIRCLERGANRAAIVVGWCFAYDVVRWWVHNDPARLLAFNTELATYTKRNGARLYDDIKDYDDFHSNKAPAEGLVIEICEGANLFGGKVARNLRHYLDVRNDYAHATPSNPTPNQADGYVTHLLDIITSQPFAKP